MIADLEFVPSKLREDSGLVSSQFSIGGISVRLAGHRGSDVTFGNGLEPFRVEADNPDIEIRVAWIPQVHTMPGCTLFDSGTTWRLFESQEGFRFDFGVPASNPPHKRLLIDRYFRQATLQMSESFFQDFPNAADPLAYPLDELLIMHRLTQEKAIELHGSGVVTRDGVGNLFVGHSGAGKSTTTQLWTSREAVEVLSDDRIIVRRQDGQILMYGTPWHGEAAYASPSHAPLTRIFILEHGHGNVLTRLSKSQAVGELFARSFVPFHRHEYLESALTFLEELAETIPCYRYSFEPDDRAVDTILNFHD